MVRNGNVVYFLYLQYIYFNIFYIRLRRGGEVQGGGWNLPVEGIKHLFGLVNEGREVLGGQEGGDHVYTVLKICSML